MIFGKKEKGGDSGSEELARQNRIMREALEFYATPDSWMSGHKYVDADNATIFTDGSESAATVDKGAKAYRALEECKQK